MPLTPSLVVPNTSPRRVLVRRNCPETALPTGASTIITAETGWALGTRANVVTGATFGDNPLILIGVSLGASGGGTVVTPTTSLIVKGVAQLRLYADLGRGEGDQLIAELPYYGHGFATYSGVVLDTITMTLVCGNASRHALPHRLFPPYTLFRGDSAAGVITSNPTVKCQLYFYEASKYNLFELPIVESVSLLGDDFSVDYDHRQRCFPSLGAVALGSLTVWTEIEDELDADYIIEGVAWGEGNNSDGRFVVEIATCRPGSLPDPVNDIQARTVFGSAVTFSRQAGSDRYFHPFLAYKGERLMAKLLTGNATPGNFIWYGRKV